MASASQSSALVSSKADPGLLSNSEQMDGTDNMYKKPHSIGLYTELTHPTSEELGDEKDLFQIQEFISPFPSKPSVLDSGSKTHSKWSSSFEGPHNQTAAQQRVLNDAFVRAASTGAHFESLPPIIHKKSPNRDYSSSTVTSEESDALASPEDSGNGVDSSSGLEPIFMLPASLSSGILRSSQVGYVALDEEADLPSQQTPRRREDRSKIDEKLEAYEPQDPNRLSFKPPPSKPQSDQLPPQLSARNSVLLTAVHLAESSHSIYSVSSPTFSRKVPRAPNNNLQGFKNDGINRNNSMSELPTPRPVSSVSSGADIYVSDELDFNTFKGRMDKSESVERIESAYRKDFSDMFTTAQLQSLNKILDRATEDPFHVLLALQRTIQFEIAVRSSSLEVMKKWNKEFFNIMELQDSEHKFQLMRALAQDFVFTSETYGRLIISEMYLPMSEKTIHPIKLGGIAGGHKFVCQGILFKFAVDIPLESNGSTVWMYGGHEPCTEYAMKSAKHELNGIIALNNLCFQGVGNIRVPLTTIIDFRGFRVSCQALLPIDKNTLVYGSDDGGGHHKEHDIFGDAMQRTCDALNLKGHKFTPAGSHSRIVYGPVDLEGHMIGKALYAVDIARLFPPESPIHSISIKRRAPFFRMLRPELVRMFHVPLSSDAHTGFGKDDATRNNQEVDEATLFLQQEIIPAFTATLENKQHLKQYTDGSVLVREIHRWGINLRYLGVVRSRLSVTNTVGRHLILLEMILRCLKNMFRRQIRAHMEATRVTMDSPYAQAVLDLLNLFLGKDGHSRVFWRTTIKEALRETFVVGLTDEELNSNVSLKRGLNMQALLDRFQVLTGVKLIPSASTYRKGKKDTILYTDLEAVQNTVTKHMQIVDYAEGALLLLLSEKKADQAEKLRLLSLAEQKLKSARSSAMGNQAIFQLGQVFYMRHKVSSNPELVDVLSALTYYRTVIDSSSNELHKTTALKNTIELYYYFVSNSVWLQRKLFGSPPLFSHFKQGSFMLSSDSSTYSIDASPRKEDGTSPSYSKDGKPIVPSLDIHTPRSMSDSGQTLSSSSTSSESYSNTVNKHVPFLIHFSRDDTNLLHRTPSASNISVATRFHQHYCYVFEKLAQLDHKDAVKDASKYVKDACQKQGSALRCIFEVALYSPLVRELLFYYLQKQVKISVPHSPQLFIGKQKSVMYQFLVSMKDYISKHQKANPSPRNDTKPSPRLSNKESPETKLDSAVANQSTGIIRATSFSSSSYILPSCTILNLTECTSVTSTIVMALLAEMVSLQELILDHCSKISNRLASMLASSPTRPAILLKRLSLVNCVKITDEFITAMCPVEASNHCKVRKGGSKDSSSHHQHRKRARSKSNIASQTDASSSNITTSSSNSTALHRELSSSTSRTTSMDLQGVAMTSLQETNLLQEMTVLNLNGCRKITNAALTKVSMHAPKLSELDMSCSSVSNLMPLTQLPSLRKLRVAHSMIRDTELSEFVSSDSFAELFELDVSGCCLNDSVFDSVYTNLNLKQLIIHDNSSIGNKTVEQLAKFSPHLTDLDLGTVQISQRDLLVNFADKLPHLSRVKMVNAQTGINGALIAMQKNRTPIQSLEVPWCSVRDIVVIGVSQSFPHLQSLDLTGCQLSNAPLEKIKGCTNMTSLNLSWCTQLVDPTIIEIMNNCPNLTSLAFAHCPQLTSYCLESLPHGITSMDISHCNNIHDIGSIRTQCLSLRKLNLASSMIPEEKLLELFGAGLSLTSINLKACKQISSKFVARLAKYCPLLTCAILDECISLNEYGLIPLLTNCPYIQRVTLTGISSIEDKVFTHAVASQGLRHVKELNLSGCSKITDASIFAIAQNCALINELNLSGCKKVSTKSLISLAQSCTLLIVLNIFGCKHIKDEVIQYLVTHCILLERLTGVKSSGISEQALKNLPFTVE